MKIKLLIFLIFCSLSLSLWFLFHTKSYFSCLDIEYTLASIPSTKIIIENIEYLVKIDLGSNTFLFLNKESLSRHTKKERKQPVRWKDFKGKKYYSNSYILPKIKLGDLFVHNVVVGESNEEFARNITLLGTSKYKPTIGRPIFEKFKILLDFKNNKIFISNDLNKLKDLGFDISSYVKVPCKKARSGLVMEVKTDLGKKRLSIDTGSSVTVLRNSEGIKNIDQKYKLPFLKNKKFQIQDKDFGPLDLLFIDITTELPEIDGFLGMDFLKHHTIYIDFPNNVAYISRE